MTRDTRIGLLVGLLFILAFGLILSELTNPELPPAEQPPVPVDGQPLVAPDHVRPREPERYVIRQHGDEWREEVYRPREQETPVVVADPPRHVEQPHYESLAAVRQDPVVVERQPAYEELSIEQLEQRYGIGGAEQTAPRTYVVQSGDTLTSIARRMMGNESRQTVDRLYQANRGWIADPDNIPVGVELVLP